MNQEKSFGLLVDVHVQGLRWHNEDAVDGARRNRPCGLLAWLETRGVLMLESKSYASESLVLRTSSTLCSIVSEISTMIACYVCVNFLHPTEFGRGCFGASCLECITACGTRIESF